MKFVVAQIGARRGYAVPAILEKAGMLERFYTDITGDNGIASRAATLPFLGKGAQRLVARRLPPNIRSLTTTFPGQSLRRALRRAVRPPRGAEAFRESVRFSNALGHAMVRRGFGEATHLYSMLGECAPLLVAAKKRGLTVVSEIYVLLSAERILAEERKEFPGWEPDALDYAAVRREIGDGDVLLTRTDFAICPSLAVRDDLVQNFGFPVECAAIAPYGMNPELLSVRNAPVRGRVLFAGTAELRKGIHYLAMAAEKLSARGLRYEFRIAGNVQPAIANQPACRHLTFLGRIPRAEMAREFAQADLFVLPSLAEGSAEVTYEALACGLPVVTTPEAGSVVQDGVEGRIAPARDPDSLADAIAEIVEDREKRDRMALAARERAKEFTWARYGERLVTALQTFSQVRPSAKKGDNILIRNRATVVITTKNRKDELRVAVRSALAQTLPVEVLVIDDGSTDGTTEMVRAEFPSVCLERREESRGLIARRNEAARIACGDILFSIDDDAEFSAPDIVEDTLHDFEDSRVAAVAIPFRDLKKGPLVKQTPPGDGRWITNEYIGTAHAVRRDIFIKLGGYREALVHQGEEGDFCIRLLDAGFLVQLGRAKPILHYESPKRSSARMNLYGQRNLMLFAWHNVPMPHLLVHLPATVWNGLTWGLKHGVLIHRALGTCTGIAAILRRFFERDPVRRSTYVEFRRLKKNGPVQMT